MRILLDTHLLLWAVAASRRVPAEARALVTDPRHDVFYSAASIWEIAIKAGLGRDNFRVDIEALLRGAAGTGFVELTVRSDHAARVVTLAGHHRDPFDRLLIAQALTESAILLTNDEQLRPYGPVVRVV